MALCKSCDAEIFWADTEHGRPMPLERQPRRVAVVVDGEIVRWVDGYEPHWANCPEADLHRQHGEQLPLFR